MKALYQPTPHSFSANDQLFPPFTWTPQKWVEPGFNPLYIHLTHAPLEPGSTRVLHPNSTRFRRWVEPVSKRVRGVRKNDRSQMNVNRCRNRSSAQRSERGFIQGSLRKKIVAENAVHRKWNVGLPVIKFLFHSASFHPATMRSKNE